MITSLILLMSMILSQNSIESKYTQKPQHLIVVQEKAQYHVYYKKRNDTEWTLYADYKFRTTAKSTEAWLRFIGYDAKTVPY